MNQMHRLHKLFSNHPFVKLLAVLFVLFFYFLFVIRTHSISDGIFISILSWSFFVLCTPIADAGVLLDLPIKLITGWKMKYSEIVVWLIAISLNIYTYFGYKDVYENTILLSLFKHILETPFPFWGIILVSAVGTFMSIYIADELTDDNEYGRKKKVGYIVKNKVIVFVFLIAIVLVLYDFLLNKLGIHIPLL